MSAGHIFENELAGGKTRAKNGYAAWEDAPERFTDRPEAERMMERVLVPATFRWAYATNAKAATTAILMALYRLEFGHALTARMDDPFGMNSEQSPHQLAAPRIFARLDQVADPLPRLDTALRFAAVREPFARALSGFRYICRAQEIGTSFLFSERVHMDAEHGFDWNTDPLTEKGFLIYLDYVEAGTTRPYPNPNPHLRPQWMNINAGPFRPDLLGRIEALPALFTALAERLDEDPAPIATSLRPRNTSAPVEAALDTPATRAAAERALGPDYDLYERAAT